MPQRTITELAVLGMLEHLGGEASGYDLKRFADASLGYLWAPSRTQLYVTLGRLVDAGLATVRDVPQSQRPDKKVYSATAAGTAELRGWLEQDDPEADPDRSIFMLKFFFGAQAAPEAMRRQLIRFGDAYRRRLDVYRGIQRSAGSGGTRDAYTYQALLYGIARAEAAVTWAQAAAEALEPAVTA